MKRSEIENRAKLLLLRIREALREEAGPDAAPEVIDQAAVGRAVIAVIQATVERNINLDVVSAVLMGIITIQRDAGIRQADGLLQIEARYDEIWGENEQFTGVEAMAAGRDSCLRTMQTLLPRCNEDGAHVDMLIGMLSSTIESFWGARDRNQPPEVIRVKLERLCMDLIGNLRVDAEQQQPAPSTVQ